MPVYKLPYGSGYREINIPEPYHPDLIAPKDVPPAPDPYLEVANAIQNPLGGVDISTLGHLKSVAIAINDKTRPVPNHILLSGLLTRLEEIGFSPDAISLIIATGTHLPMQPDEFQSILPQAFIDRYPIFSHDTDANNQVKLGTTSRGTPVLVNRLFMEAGLRIVVGNIEPHHFMGFSGGAKTAAIGLAGRTTINQNHSLLPHPLAKTGHYADNPMRQEVEEIGKMIGIHFALNAILNNNKQIVRVLAGDPVAVMEAGIPLTREICQVTADGTYDLVIASSGGHPKDINLYQSQKGLTHAALMTKDNGTVILLAACPEGSGSAGYEKFMQGLTTYPEVFTRFAKQGFEVGPHKAFLVARDASRVNVLLYSNMASEKVRQLLLTPVENLDIQIKKSLENLPAFSKIAIMPIATITIPVIGL